MNLVALLAGVEDLGRRRSQTFVILGNDEVHAAQAPAGQGRRNPFQNASASEGPVSRPSTSRRPSVLSTLAAEAALRLWG